MFLLTFLLSGCLNELPELPHGKFADRPDEDFDLDGITEIDTR